MTAYLDYFKDKCQNRELWLQYCPQCQVNIFYPRGHCPHCLGSELQWKPVAGHGTLHSYTIVHVSALPEFAALVPYVYALIDLHEGVRIAGNIVDCPVKDVHVGMLLELCWIEREGRQLPVFKPLSAKK